jgi:hypothetical protein
MTILRTTALSAALVLSLGACSKKPAPPPESATAALQALAAIVATCGEATGDVQVRRAGQTAWMLVETGAAFRAGDEIRTGPQAFTRVEFLNGGGLELQADASVIIDVAPAQPKGAAGAEPAPPEARVAITGGEVQGFLPEAAPGAAPAGLVIRGADGAETRLAAAPGQKRTGFRLSQGKKGTEVAVTQGEARIVTGAGATTALRRGQAVEIGGAAVSAPVQLIDFPPSTEPGIDARFLFKPGMVVKMSWRAVPEATGYRVQVGHDLAFQTIDLTKELTATELTFSPNAPGMRSWRVAAKDADGRYGEYGFARRYYTEKEPPRDLLIGPEDGATLRFTDSAPPINFSWASAGAANSYKLVVAKGPDLLNQKVVAMTSEGQRVQLEGLDPGELYWGVYVDDDKAPEPIFVKPRKLVLEKVEKPRVTVPKALDQWGK